MLKPKVILLMMIVKITSTMAAPMQLQLLQPMQLQMLPQMQAIMIPPQQNLQQQLMFLQPQLELLRSQQLQLLDPMLNGYQNQFLIPQNQQLQRNNINKAWNSQQPIQIFLLPNTASDFHTASDNQGNDKEIHEEMSDQDYDAEDIDSIIIDAQTKSSFNHVTPNNKPETQQKISQKAILLFPNGRLSIADIIYAIPWLPFEVNVPDTIAWAYNGIAGIIAGIGQRLPFRPKPQPASTVKPEEQTTTSVKALIQRLQMEKQKNASELPIVVMPVNRPMLNTKF